MNWAFPCVTIDEAVQNNAFQLHKTKTTIYSACNEVNGAFFLLLRQPRSGGMEKVRSVQKAALRNNTFLRHEKRLKRKSFLAFRNYSSSLRLEKKHCGNLRRKDKKIAAVRRKSMWIFNCIWRLRSHGNQFLHSVCRKKVKCYSEYMSWEEWEDAQVLETERKYDGYFMNSVTQTEKGHGRKESRSAYTSADISRQQGGRE